MSNISKNLHVHFDDDVEPTSNMESPEIKMDEQFDKILEWNSAADIKITELKYPREKLMELKRNYDERWPNLLDRIYSTDEHRMQKMQHLFEFSNSKRSSQSK